MPESPVIPIEAHVVSAFIDGAQGDIPAGVVLDDNALDAQQKLKVARRMGLSETALVSNSASDTIRHCKQDPISRHARALGARERVRLGAREMVMDCSRRYLSD